MSTFAVDVINKTCINKVSLTKEQADEWIDTWASRGIVFYYYKCPFCSAYHATKKEYSYRKVQYWSKNDEIKND